MVWRMMTTFSMLVLTAVSVISTFGCSTHTVSGPTGVIEGQRVGGGPLVDCRGYFAQSAQDLRASINALQGPGFGFGFGSSPLLALDSISGDMIVHYQRFCHQYNIGMISREEFLRKTDMLYATQTAIRAMVGAAPQQLPLAPAPGLTPLGTVVLPSGANIPTLSVIGSPEASGRRMEVAESIFKTILEAMRPVSAEQSLPLPPVAPPASSSTETKPPSGPASPAPVQQVLTSASDSTANPDDLLKSLVADLARYATNRPATNSPMRAVIGEINYRNTEFASPLSLFIKNRLRQELFRSGNFVLVDAPRVRGVDGITKSPPVFAPVAAGGAEVVINGNYWESPEGVELLVSIRQEQGEVLGVARTHLPSRMLPQNIAIIPANLREARLNEAIEDGIAPLSAAQVTGPLKVEVRADKGAGSIYSEGEQITFMVRVDQDAHVRLYYTDANNQVYQIFPNQYRTDDRIRGGQVIAIPAPEDKFAFQVKPPFGVETVTALASRKPFAVAAGNSVPAGPFFRVPSGVRGLGVVSASSGEKETVRDRVVLTTVPSNP